VSNRAEPVVRLVQDYLDGLQANFDHLNGELKKQAQYHNEHLAETELVANEAEKHEHDEKLVSAMPGRTHVLRANTAWSETGYETQDIYFWSGCSFVPIYIDHACTISRVGVNIAEGFDPYVPPYDAIHLAIYNGDNEANLPGSLLKNLGVQETDATFDYTLWWEANVQVGPGWVWVGGSSVNTDDNDPVYVEGMNTTGAGVGGAFVSNAWPFTHIAGNGDTGPEISDAWLGVVPNDWTFDVSFGPPEGVTRPPAYFQYVRPEDGSEFPEDVGGDFFVTQLVPTYLVEIT
jgi:hypothetical protein